MNKAFISTILAALLVATFTVAAQAQTGTPRVTKRQIHQRHRIHQGVKSGELTKGEQRKLNKEQKEIRTDKRAAKSDGVVTKDERKDLRKDQNKASRDIYRLKHNKRKRHAKVPTPTESNTGQSPQ